MCIVAVVKEIILRKVSKDCVAVALYVNKQCSKYSLYCFTPISFIFYV